jgi:hypothetical protein
MLGRYLSSHRGDILGIPSSGQRRKVKLALVTSGSVGRLPRTLRRESACSRFQRPPLFARAQTRPACKFGVGEGLLGDGHAHLALAAHDLEALSDSLLLLLCQSGPKSSIWPRKPLASAAKAIGKSILRERRSVVPRRSRFWHNELPELLEVVA